MDERAGTLFLGIGGAGCRMLDAFRRFAPEDPPCTILAHTDASLLESLNASRRLVLGGEAAEGLKTGGDPEAGRRAAEASEEALLAGCDGARMVVLVTGLGGGTGTGAAPFLARRLREAGVLVLALVTLPFFFEGPQRRKRAEKGLREIRAGADGVIVFPNQRMLDLFDRTAPAAETFGAVDRAIGEALLALARVLEGQGLIRLDVADLRAMVSATGGTLAMAESTAQGEDRVARAVDDLARSPLLEHGNVLSSARDVLVCVRGGADLCLSEVQDVMMRLSDVIHPEAEVRVGVDVRPDYEGRLALTVLAAETEVVPPPMMDPESSSRPAAESEPKNPSDAPPSERRRGKTTPSRVVQGSLPLDGSGKGRFRDVEPTLYEGEDLDVPTFIRRGLPLRK